MEIIVQNVLQKMGIVGKPQWKALTLLFTTILTLCGKVNYTNLSRYSGRNEKTFRRQSSQPFNFPVVREFAKIVVHSPDRKRRVGRLGRTGAVLLFPAASSRFGLRCPFHSVRP